MSERGPDQRRAGNLAAVTYTKGYKLEAGVENGGIEELGGMEVESVTSRLENLTVS